MKPFHVDGTNTTFQVTLDQQEGIFEFSGKSRPENVVSFFEPIFEWFEQYFESPNDLTSIDFRLEYFNSSTAKVLLRFLVKLEEYNLQGHNLSVRWYYHDQDEDMFETGEDFESLIELPFELIAY